MLTPREDLTILSNTGPLISAFQSASFDTVVALFGTIHISNACRTELVRHGWEQALVQAGSCLVSHKLTPNEEPRAAELARRIAAHAKSNDPEPSDHLGEAEVMVLAQQSGFVDSVVLLDELAARAVATELGLNVSGFAGVLLLAVEECLLSADEVRKRLKLCQQQGTHYSDTFIGQVYQAAKEAKR